MGSLSSKEIIEHVVGFDNNEHSFVKTYGGMIGNRPYDHGYREFVYGQDTRDAFIYKALSAIGNEVGDTVFLNVRKYIDFVSNVDVCKTASLRSMLAMFGYKYTILDSFNSIPEEIVKLVDVLSINRKAMLKSGVLKPEFLDILTQDGLEHSPVFSSVPAIDFTTAFTNTSYDIQLPSECVGSYGLDVQKFNGMYSFISTPAFNDVSSMGISEEDYAELSIGRMLQNNYGYYIVDVPEHQDDENGTVERTFSFYDRSLQKLMHFTYAAEAMSQLSQNNSISEFSLLDEDAVTFDKPCILNIDDSSMLSVSTKNLHFNESLDCIDEQRFDEFVEELFFTYLSAQLLETYNFDYVEGGKILRKYIYPYLGRKYFEDDVAYHRMVVDGYDDSSTSAIVQLKAFNHIPKTFNEKKIVDDIVQGLDSYENYSGAELSALRLETETREQPVDFKKLGMQDKTGKANQTRYSWYREDKVAKYAKFIDSYYSSIEMTPNAYKFDVNYNLVSTAPSKTVICQSIDMRRINPKVDIDFEMVRTVSHYLAMVVSYICKIREKLKFQTQKNYMRGTDLLIIYVINEFLNEYASVNKKFFLEEDERGQHKYPELVDIYSKLSCHQFSYFQGNALDNDRYTVEINEYYDVTQYDNISTATSISANDVDVNPRFWELTSASKPAMMKYDGLAFSLDEIENFYLSTLGLDTSLCNNLQDFLSTLYDIGANDTFIFSLSSHPELSVFSSQLSDGVHASDIVERFIKLSTSYDELNEKYIDSSEYSYPEGSISAQVIDSHDNYIFPKLSNEFFKDVSSVYVAHHGDVVQASASIDSLSSRYNQFISSEYGFYYTKSESKYCYEDWDPDVNASYMFAYYAGNSQFDTEDMPLYEHLRQLQMYSTTDNIQNHALLEQLNYISSGFNDIYNDLESSVIAPIVIDYGFIDIHALTLDDELKYTYDFLQEQASTRKDFLVNQLQSLQQQANALKQQYDTLNNTFTNAVASFNDNYDGYSLGDSVVHCVSLRTDSNWPGEKCSRVSDEGKAPKPKGDIKWAVFVNESNHWFFKRNDGGDYPLSNITLQHPYDPSSSLLDRCEQVKEYTTTPTSMIIDGDGKVSATSKGLANEGIIVVCDNVQNGITNIQTSYTAVCQQAETLFGINTDFPEVDLYQKILALIAALVAVDQASFNNDALIVAYNNYIKTVINLSGQYIPVKQSYDSMFSDSSQQTYLADFRNSSNLTQEQLNLLSQYIHKKDASNLLAIQKQIANFIEVDFAAIKDQINDAIESLNNDNVFMLFACPNAGDNNVENQVQRLENHLVSDMSKKYEDAMTLFTQEKDHVLELNDCISSEISAYLSSNETFDSRVNARIAEMNFFESQQYKDYMQLFLTYGGKDFCYDPYYNIKNKTHASYQIHPFLWNLKKKLDTDTLILQSFNAKAVQDLIDDNDVDALKAYIGDYGQTIDTWKHYKDGLVDYSGYVSRYEKSDNIAKQSNIENEVVDYDGAFYQPAVNEFLSSANACINSVSNQATQAYIAAKVSDVLQEEFDANGLTSHITANDSGLIVSNDIYNIISSIVVPYGMQNSVKASINEYMSSSTTTSSSITASAVKAAAAAGVPKTFYERFYRHLGMSQKQSEYVAAQLSEYKLSIENLVTPRATEEQYDIYRYGLDMNRNSYILFKQYDPMQFNNAGEASYKQKRNTLGEIWIRLADSPIAFPAFAGEHPAYYINETEILATGILNLAKLGNCIEWGDDEKTLVKKIKGQMKYFYDFEIPQNKTSISYVAFNHKMPLGDAFYAQYDLAQIVSDSIQNYYSPSKGIEWLSFKNDSANNIDYVDFTQDSLMPIKALYDITSTTQLKKGIRYPALIGSFIWQANKVCFAYMYKKFIKHLDEATGNATYTIDVSNVDTELDDSQLPSDYDDVKAFFVVAIEDGTVVKTIPGNGEHSSITQLASSQTKTYGNNACVSFDRQRGYMSFAFATEITQDDASKMLVETCESVDFIKNTDGPTIDDPTSSEMNSHDMFMQNVTVLDYALNSNGAVFKKSSTYNINADMSYMPAYPGVQHEFDVVKTYGKEKKDTYSIELLGMSKDIDSIVKLVNPNPNPYFDFDLMLENSAFGRVYEDYSKEDQKTFGFVSLPSLNNNMPPDDGTTRPLYRTTIQHDTHEFVFTLDMQRINKVPFTQKDFQNIELLVYNQDALGKRPYYIGKLSSLTSDFVDFQYDAEEISLGTDAEEIIRSMSNDGQYATVVGTHSTALMRSSLDTNHINGITKISGKADFNGGLLQISFTYDDSKPEDFIFVKKDEVKVLLYNTKDLTTLKYFHLLDAYGAINCKYLPNAYTADSYNQLDDGRGWRIVFDDGTSDDLSDLMASYYIGPDGKKTYLRDVELSDYDEISDVYVLDGNKKLGFKIDEQLRFEVSSDLYYYPTLNLNYPLNIANVVNIDGSFNDPGGYVSYMLSNMYDDTNLFILDLDDDKRILEKIGAVDVPVMYVDVDDVRAFEDYLSVDADGRDNFSKYDVEDPRSFQYVHFCANDSGTTTSEIEIPDPLSTNASMLNFLDNVERIAHILPLRSEESTVKFETRTTRIQVTSSNCDIKRFLKVYASYKKDDATGTIDLYFNYYNYVNSPFVKIDNGNQIKVDTIPSTYLKLKAGEEGMLDIMLQFKNYVGTTLQGYKNVKVLSYKICNVSDDKPKFLVKKMFEVVNGQQEIEHEASKAEFNISNVEIDLDETTDPNAEIDVECSFGFECNKMQGDQFEAYLYYPEQLLQLDTSFTDKYMFGNDTQEGIAHLIVYNAHQMQYKVKFKTSKIASLMAQYAGMKYELSIDDVHMLDSTGVQFQIAPCISTLSVKKDNTTIWAYDASKKIAMSIGDDTALKFD